MAPPEPPLPLDPTPAPAPVITKHDWQIRRLLDEAAAAFADNKLTTPVDDNAYYRYLRVLSIDANNERAEQGIADIVDKYLEWSIENVRQDRLPRAVSYLRKAKSIDEHHPGIPAVESLIAEQRAANRMTYRLSAPAIDEKAPRAVAELREIGGKIARENAMVVITGRTDEEGRWIYQQLNDATPSRVRARFELGNHPSVRLTW